MAATRPATPAEIISAARRARATLIGSADPLPEAWAAWAHHKQRGARHRAHRGPRA